MLVRLKGEGDGKDLKNVQVMDTLAVQARVTQHAVLWMCVRNASH